MVFRSMCQRLGCLFRRHDTDVTDDAAMHRMRIIEIHDLLYKVGAIALQQLVGFEVRFGVKPAD